MNEWCTGTLYQVLYVGFESRIENMLWSPRPRGSYYSRSPRFLHSTAGHSSLFIFFRFSFNSAHSRQNENAKDNNNRRRLVEFGHLRP